MEQWLALLNLLSSPPQISMSSVTSGRSYLQPHETQTLTVASQKSPA